MPKPYLVDLPERVVRAARPRRIARCRFPLSSIRQRHFLYREALPPAQRRGTVTPRTNRIGRIHLGKVAEKADITMPELAAGLAPPTCEKADPGFAFTLAHPHRLSLQNVWLEPFQKGMSRLAADQSASTYLALEVFPPGQGGDTCPPVISAVRLPG
jgi:hypothetical protein